MSPLPSGLSRDEVHDYVQREPRLVTTEPKNKVTGYGERAGRTLLYVSNKLASYPVAVHPDFADALKRGAAPGVVVSPKTYSHSSNYSAFPKGMSREGQMQHRACHVDVRDYPALNGLLDFISGRSHIPVSMSTAPADSAGAEIEVAAAEAAGAFDSLSHTEKEAVVKARIGQGQFRADLERVWAAKCAVTGIGVSQLLRASHIKPWRDADNSERLDADNGILLVATLDAAFDAGLISFADDGAMLLSKNLGSSPESILGITVGARLRIAPSAAQQEYLRHHRKGFLAA